MPISDLLGTALKSAVGALAGPVGAIAPVVGGLASNVLSGINQRAARNWEEDMYNKYNSPSALVRQYEDAGINPALMFGGQTPAASTDTQAAPVADMQTGTVTEMLAQLMNLDLLSEEKNLKHQQANAAAAAANQSNAAAAGQSIENEFKPRILEQSLEKGELDIQQSKNAIARFEDELENLRASTQEYKTRSQYNAASALLQVANRAFVGLQGQQVSLQNARLAFENEFQSEFGIRPDEPIWNSITGLFGKTARELSNGDALMNPLKDFGSKALDWFSRNSVFGYGKFYGTK